MSTPPSPFVPALVVIDMQNDFCEGGSLAVNGGRALVPKINHLLGLPFALKIASRDWHPANHQSFASQHAGKSPFDSYTMTNVASPSESKDTTLWPDHCIRDTPGAAFVEGLDSGKLHTTVLKGTIPEVETYSFMSDIFGNTQAGFSEDVRVVLKEKDITHAYVVGLAGDFCVKYSALDLQRAGLKTFVLEDITAYVDSGKGREECLKQWVEEDVTMIRSDGNEVQWVEGLKV